MAGADDMKILIGYDGSACAEAVLDDLPRAGLPDNVEVQILSVAEVWVPPPSSYERVEQTSETKVSLEPKLVHPGTTRAIKEAQSFADGARQRVQTIFPRWDVWAEASSGSPAWELVHKADQWKPDLIVVGSHGRGVIGRFMLGSVSQEVLTETKCSVRIARAPVAKPGLPVKVIIGIDGSPGSEAAVRAVAGRVWPPGSEAKLIVVDDPLRPGVAGDLITPLGKILEEVNSEELAWAVRIAAEAEALLHGADIKVAKVRRHGEPKRELPRAAEEWGADCIFVGATGFSNRFERFVLGSVSAAVAARAHCSVEVVRSRP
jgi:nucleotide-binding universal stress UspA family protein